MARWDGIYEPQASQGHKDSYATRAPIHITRPTMSTPLRWMQCQFDAR